jgi:rhamnogalacturonan endolyase
MYPNDDLVYTVGVSDYRRDWFFAHVPRKKGDVHEGTTWQIIFNLENIDQKANYKLRVAIASATLAELQVKMKLHFSTEKNEIRL